MNPNGHLSKWSQYAAALCFAFLFNFSADAQLHCSSTNSGNGFNDVSGISTWSAEASATSNYLFGYPTSNGDGDTNNDGDISPNSNAWGLFAYDDQTAGLTVNFDFPVTPGDEISIDMDNGWVDGGTVGIGLQNSSDENLLEFYFRGGETNYIVNDASGEIPTSIEFTDEGLELIITLVTATTVSIEVRDIFNNSTTNYSANLINPAGGQDITQIRLFNYNAGEGEERRAYFNNLEVCQSIVDLDYDGAYNDVDCDDNDDSIQGPITLYADVDGDGYGDASNSIESCPTAGYVADDTDCNDLEAGENPGNFETLYNGLNDDCDDATPDTNSGIYESFVIVDNVYYDLGSATGNPDFENADLGSFDCNGSLILNGGQNKTYKCVDYYEADITGSALAYRLYEIGSTPGSFTEVGLPFASNDASPQCQNQTWEANGLNIDLLSGLAPGAYSLEVYTSANHTYFVGSGTHYANNGGSNYIATFTVEDDTEAPVAACNDFTLALGADGMATLTVEDVDAGSTDNCGIASISLSQTEFTCADIPQAGPSATDLIISEYVEGGGNNKYVELFNGTSNEIDLSDYEIRIYSNGSTSINSNGTTTLGGAGVLASGEILVLANSSAAGLPSEVNVSTIWNAFFNGDDAIELYNLNTSTSVDIIGVIGNDPGSYWGSSSFGTANHSLRRNSNITSGNTSSDWELTSIQSEWSASFQDDLSNLGSHEMDGGGPSTVPVTLTVTDAAGNEGTCVSNLTIEIPLPVAIAADITVALDENGEGAIVADDVDGGSFTACGEGELSIDNGLFDCSNLGENFVSITITDAFGNDSTDIATVMVVDEVAPIAICQNLVVELDENGMATISADDINNNSSDNCGIASMDIDVTSFDCTDIDNEIVVPESEIWINEVHYDNDGVDVNEFVEIVSNFDAEGYVFHYYSSSSSNTSVTIQSSNLDESANGFNVYVINYSGLGNSGPKALAVSNGIDAAVDFVSYEGSMTATSGPASGQTSTNIGSEPGSTPIGHSLQLSGTGSSAADFVWQSPADDTPGALNNGQTLVAANPVGIPVELTVTDGAGNTANCTAYVVVVDAMAPEAVCENVTVNLDASGQANVTAELLAPDASDNCAIADITLSNTAFDCSDISEELYAVDLIISEYVEGSSNHKFIEVYNGTGADVDLSNYALRLYSNGNNSPSNTSALSGNLPSGQTKVFENSSAGLGVNGTHNAAVGFNGDDAIALYNSTLGQNIDIFGEIGDDPGSYWNVGGNRTQNRTLRRLPSVVNGNTSNAAGFPSLGSEWEEFNENDVSDLGMHTSVAGGIGAIANEVMVTITDVNGNAFTCTSAITVLDITPPTAICQNLTIQLDETGNASITAEGVNNGSSDACGIEGMSLNQTDFSCSHVGLTNTVTLSVTDVNGLISTCTAEITVEDVSAPTVSAPADLNIGTDVGMCAAQNIGFAMATGTDNCSGLVISSDAPTAFPIGITTVIWTATDASGHTATDTQTVTVSDDEEPTISAPATITVNADQGICSATITDLGMPTATDNCGIPVVSNNASTTFPVGISSVIWTATDAAGNASTSTQLVEVLDAENPTAVCVSDLTVQLNANGLGTISASDLDNGSFDNCGAVSLSISQNTFTCADMGESAIFANDLFISEYFEGSSGVNKYIEIYNGTGSPVDLGGYSIRVHANGNNSGNSGSLSGGGILASGEVAVFGNNQSIMYGGPTFDLSVLTFNGDDAVVLLNGSNPIDIIGKIGQDPGSQWSQGGNSTEDMSLRRLPSIIAGNTDDVSDFPSLGAEWTSASQNDVSDLGQHTSDAGAAVNTGVAVTLTVTDAAGNTSTCIANVTVEDNVAPNALCQDVDLYLDSNGQATLSIEDVNNGSSDICGIANIELDITDFDCSDIPTEASEGNGAFINEFHYDNDGTDTGEFVEVVVPSDFDGSNYTVHLYNGNGGSEYNSQVLGSSVYTEGDFNIFLWNVSGIQNGAPDGIALADENGELVEFISYEGTFTASNGPAAGITSTNVGVSEPGAIGESIQRIGTGTNGSAFSWSGPSASSPGTINNGQSFDANGPVNPVVLTVTDVNGNSSTCTASVNVIDNISPTLLVQNLVVSLDDAGQAVITADEMDDGSSDNCEIESVSINNDIFDCSHIGTNTVTFTATDIHGNESSTTATVTVEDNTNPVANCAESIDLELGPNGTAILTASEVNLNSTDNCAVTGLVLSDTDFDCSDLPTNAPQKDEVWINEIHYDNAGGDVDEMVEIAANFDISDYKIVFYNGSNNSQYDPTTITLANILGSQGDYDFYVIDGPNGGIQNGAPDGIALVDNNGDLVQFLSYEGSFTANNGPAAGITSTDIGVSETGSTPSTHSLQLAGTGTNYDDFVWQSPATATAGAVNNGQSFGAASGGTEVALVVSDASGNQATCTTIVNVIDVAVPVVQCQDITVYLDATGNATVLPDDIDDGSYDACGGNDISTAISKGSFNCDDIGDNSVTLTVTDGSGNQDACGATVTVIDNIPPTAICQNATAYIGADGFAWIEADDIDGGSSDNCGIDHLWINNDRFDCTQTGLNTVTLFVHDESGNVSQCDATVMVIDNIAPIAACTNATVYLDGTGQASISVDDIDNGSSDVCGIANIALSQTTFDCDDAGVVSVTMTVTDHSGNVATCTSTVTVVDNTSPTITCQDVTMALDATGNLQIAFDDIVTAAADNCDIQNIVLSQTVFSCNDIGENSITATITDYNGNEETCTSTLTIVDNTAPNAICKHISITLDETGSASIVAADVDEGSNDNCGDVTISIDNTTFDCSNIGVNNVTLTVTDDQGLTAYCTAMVIVEDQLPPTAICQPITIELNGMGVATASAESVNAGSTDNCGLASFALSQSTFGCTDLGVNDVTLTVTDVNGNSSTCETTITVVDNTNPTVVCQNLTLSLDAIGQASLTAAQVNNGSADNCGNIDLSIDIMEFDCNNLGDNIVTLTGTDASGNTASCSAIVTIIDDTAPVLNCKELNVVLDETGFAMIEASDLSTDLSDNCGIASLEITNGQSQFGCEDELQSFEVTITATDVNGNTTDCTSTVHVIIVGDSDNDNVGDACDFCIGDDASGDADADGVCDDTDSCPGFDDLADPDANCDYNLSMNSWWMFAGNGGTYCVDGPFNGGHITVTNGSTVRLSGSGHISVSLYYGAKLEVMEGSDITFGYLGVHWGAEGMVVYPNAEVTYHGTFSTNATVVNCGTFTARSLRVHHSGEFINNGTLELTHPYSTSSVHGDLINNGSVHTNGSMKVHHNGKIENYCSIEVDRSMFVYRNILNHSFINVGETTRIYHNGRIYMYDSAMMQTGSNIQYGKIIGYGSTSVFKVLDNTVGFWNARCIGSIAYCDVDGIDFIYTYNYFQNGASADCNTPIAADGCNSIGHEGFFAPAGLVVSDSMDELNGSDLASMLSEEDIAIIADRAGALTEFTVWPNPTTGDARITIIPAKDDRMVIELYSVSGELVERLFEGEAFKNSLISQDLDMAKYDNGVYFIRVIQDAEVQTKKIVLAR